MTGKGRKAGGRRNIKLGRKEAIGRTIRRGGKVVSGSK
jgi:hypothetical protein